MQAVSTAQGLFTYVLDIINFTIVPVIFALAFIVFIFNVYRYFIQGGANPEKVQEGRTFVIWSMVGFFLMVSIWGLVNVFVNTLGFQGASMPRIPLFGGGSSGSYSNNTPSVYPNGIANPGRNGLGAPTTVLTQPNANGQCADGSAPVSDGYVTGCRPTGAGSNPASVTSPASGGSSPSSYNYAPSNGSGSGSSGGIGSLVSQFTDFFNPSGSPNSTASNVPGDGLSATGESCAGNQNACDVGVCDDASQTCQLGNEYGSYACGDGTYAQTAGECGNYNTGTTDYSATVTGADPTTDVIGSQCFDGDGNYIC